MGMDILGYCLLMAIIPIALLSSQYAIPANIEVLCYPAHATHIYQGLDVVLISVLKNSWSEEKDIFFREIGQKVTKYTF